MDTTVANKIKKSIRSVLINKPNTSFEQLIHLLKYTNPEIFQDDKLMDITRNIFKEEASIIRNGGKVASKL